MDYRNTEGGSEGGSKWRTFKTSSLNDRFVFHFSNVFRNDRFVFWKKTIIFKNESYSF